MDIAERLRFVLSAKQVTQYRLKNEFGIPQSSISSILTGKNKNPSLELLQQIAQALGMTVSELIGETTEAEKTKVPVLGTIRAGLPILAEDNWEEEIDIPSYLDADFALRVEGDSMSWVGIHDGDLALMEQTSVASHGHIVAAGVEDNEWRATLKFFVQENGGYYLRAANPDYEDIPFTAKHRIIGRLVRVLKEAPSLQDYKNLSGSHDIHDQYWQDVIELATQKGLDGKKAKKIIEAFVETFNKF